MRRMEYVLFLSHSHAAGEYHNVLKETSSSKPGQVARLVNNGHKTTAAPEVVGMDKEHKAFRDLSNVQSLQQTKPWLWANHPTKWS